MTIIKLPRYLLPVVLLIVHDARCCCHYLVFSMLKNSYIIIDIIDFAKKIQST